MKLKPHNGTILCKMLNEEQHLANERGIVYNKNELPLYEVIDISDIDTMHNINIGDIIITNSSPSKLTLDNNVFYLIKQEYIAGKIQ